jgi:predicted component of type VI protein secretion system
MVTQVKLNSTEQFHCNQQLSAYCHRLAVEWKVYCEYHQRLLQKTANHDKKTLHHNGPAC